MTPAATLSDAIRVAQAVERDLNAYRSCPDAELLDRARLAAELRRVADAHSALATGEIARRSAAALGGAGLVHRAGHRTVEEFLKHTTGVTGRDAASAVRVGRMLHDTGGGLAPVGAAVVAGTVSVAAAESIRAGLGEASEAVPIEVLSQAAGRLCDEAQTLDPDRLQRRAREIRDEIDQAGVADREAAWRAQRSLRLVRQADGMTRIVWLIDPESAAIVTEVFDRITSPRRGGPRFVDPAARERAEHVRDDGRTTEQLASDGFTELLRQAATVDREVLLGSGAPAVRVLVAATDLERGAGHGVLEGTHESVSIATVERLACADGVQPLTIDTTTGQALDLGRSQRLFNPAQRIALAVRDGGCLWLGCERPPSWSEAHHITPWRHHGRTDIADGVLLCRHHHLQLHNEGWSITRRAGRYWLHPPPGSGRPGALLETKSRAVREIVARRLTPDQASENLMSAMG
jgi:hypothetical protein